MICNKCGTNVSHDAAYCPKCGKEIRRSGGNSAKKGIFRAVLPWEEKKLRGTLGAVLGSLAGSLLLFQVMQFSGSFMVMTLGGLLLAFTTLGGYWWLGGRLSLYGKLLCIALILFMGWLTDWIFWMLIYYINTGFFQSIWQLCLDLAEMLYKEPTSTGSYFFGLFFMYEGSLIGIIVTLLIHGRVGKY